MITTLNPCWIRITARKFKVIIRWLSIADLASIRFSSDANCLILVSQVGIISLIEGPDCAGSGAKEILETSLRGLKYDKLVSIPSYLEVLQSVWKLAKKSHYKVIQKCKKWSILENFENLNFGVKQCYQTGPFLIGLKLVKMPKSKTKNETFLGISQTMCGTHCVLVPI